MYNQTHLHGLLHKRYQSSKEILLSLERLDESIRHAAEACQHLATHLDHSEGSRYQSIFEGDCAKVIGRLLAEVYGLPLERAESYVQIALGLPKDESTLVMALQTQHEHLLRERGINKFGEIRDQSNE